jgi:hypothetical protein
MQPSQLLKVPASAPLRQAVPSTGHEQNVNNPQQILRNALDLCQLSSAVDPVMCRG